MSELGDLYYEGDRVPKDDSEAIKWWRKAAEQGGYYEGGYFAIGDLARIYAHGPDEVRDFVQAYAWYRCGQRYQYIEDCNLIAAKLSSEALTAAKAREAEIWSSIQRREPE